MSAREKILEAAYAIVRDKGVARLTLDEAAKVAGVSKGGVLYHFKSKEDLIAAMVESQVGQCDQVHQQYYAQEPEGPYRWCRTLVRSMFDPNGPAYDPVGGALLAAVTFNPDLVTPIRGVYDEWVGRLKSDSPDFMRAALVSLAMDGLYFQRMMGLQCLDESQLQALQQAALDLLKGEDGATE